MKLRSRRYLSIAGISVLALGLAGFLLLGRGSQPASAAAESVTYSVKKGDLSTDITAGGNLALSLKEDVAFKVSGYVEDVLVSEGESVKKGQVVARLDATPLDLALLKAEDAFAKAERALEDTKEPYSEVDKAVAVASLAAAESRLSGAYNSWASDQGSASKWSAVKSAEADLARARETMAEIESGPDPKDVASAERQLRIAQASLDDARAQLKEATLAAPFTGFVTSVNVKGGDEVKKGTVAVQLADPNKFEAEIMVNENNVFRLKLGDMASVKVEALPAVALVAKVTDIAPTATVQSGVVNYKVKVEVERVQAAIDRNQAATQAPASSAVPATGTPDGGVMQRQSIAGAASQVQQGADLRARTQVAPQSPGAGALGQGSGGTTTLPQNVQLKEGLTITVSIVTEQRKGVLLVPNSAIASRGGKTYVQVPKGDVTEERQITADISNWQYTEVVDGLSEGDKVVIAKAAATQQSSAQRTTTGAPPVFIPGMGPVMR